MNSLIDIGANLTHSSFDNDVESSITRAKKVGVDKILVTGANRESTEKALHLSNQYPSTLYSTAGVHPHHASEYNSSIDSFLRKTAIHPKIVAIGECGLDYFRNLSPSLDQKKAFKQQLEIAVDLNKPVFLHQRDAHKDFLDLLKPYIGSISGGVAHCFTAGKKELECYLDLGLFIGITGWICDERRGQELRDAVKSLPLNRVMIETDSPYLMPKHLNNKKQGRRNEPSNLPHILNALSHYMEKDIDSIAKASTENAIKLFKLEV
ncbi:MAG: TatD family hydrolase [Pseudomonadota bacterium]|nr:TatD family hydrolase [Pseudomonadota bacterium]